MSGSNFTGGGGGGGTPLSAVPGEKSPVLFWVNFSFVLTEYGYPGYQR